MLAGGGGLGDELGVRPRRGKDEHRVDRLVAEYRGERIDHRKAPGFRRLLAPLARGRERRRHLDAVRQVREAQRMGLQRHAEADDADAVLRHFSPRHEGAMPLARRPLVLPERTKAPPAASVSS